MPRPFFPTIWLLTAALVILPGNPASAGRRPYEAVDFKTTAIPLINFSSDHGTGYGLRVNLFDYDGKSMPYARAYSFQVFFTTRGKWVHRVRMDTPNLRPGQRLEIEILYEKEDFANYFGNLEDEVLDARTEDQKTFGQTKPRLRLMWIRNLQDPWRFRAGFELSHNSITPNTKEGSILTELVPLGADGGTLLQINTSLRYDTRDDYTNSTRGFLEEFFIEYGLGAGGDFNGARLSYEHRHFQNLMESLVFAHRATADLTLGDVPFYEELELGGSSTVRGLAAARVRGQGRFLLNSELRWQGLRLSQQQNMYTGLLLFWDAGQIFRRADGPSLDDWRSGRGAGLRFYWHSTIVRADYGISGSRTGIYITFSQVF